jgi:hypothetical protein
LSKIVRAEVTLETYAWMGGNLWTGGLSSVCLMQKLSVDLFEHGWKTLVSVSAFSFVTIWVLIKFPK